MTDFHTIDYLIFAIYGVMILSVGLWVSRGKKGEKKSAQDYFLAGKSLPFWASRASLIAANISAEQFLGMSGSGFAIGLAIASYEWMAALTLLIVAKFFLPVFIKEEIFTIPEFVERRFNTQLKTILAIFWISLFIFVNLTSVLFLGATALDTILGNADGELIFPFILGLAFFAAAYSIWGGLSAVAWTDVIQVVLLVVGGLQI
jgi:SSS family solute:Na+ symporter